MIRTFYLLLPLALSAASCSDKTVESCGDAIKRTLKAPATYKLVSAKGIGPKPYSYLEIEYDADNSFGVPLRAKGNCLISSPGHAVWLPETPAL